MSLTLVLSLLYFVRIIEPVTLRMRKYLFKQICIRILKPKNYWWKISTLFCLVSGHQAPCSIAQSLSKSLLGISLILTHTELVLPFGIPWKHKKTLRFSDFFRWSVPKGNIGSMWVKFDFFFQSFDILVLSDVLF